MLQLLCGGSEPNPHVVSLFMVRTLLRPILHVATPQNANPEAPVVSAIPLRLSLALRFPALLLSLLCSHTLSKGRYSDRKSYK